MTRAKIEAASIDPNEIFEVGAVAWACLLQSDQEEIEI
jgi:hypothetical protein